MKKEIEPKETLEWEKDYIHEYGCHPSTELREIFYRALFQQKATIKKELLEWAKENERIIISRQGGGSGKWLCEGYNNCLEDLKSKLQKL